jgi:glycosidase
VPGWPVKPFIYQINTWVWLNTLSRKYHRTITLHDVPDEELDLVAEHAVDAVWLMGIWKRSPWGARRAVRYIDQYREALPDITAADIVGSAYAIADYRVQPELGGPDGLASIRNRLKKRGLRLLLDYVPNHVAIDHHWVREHPGYFIQGSAADLKRRPLDFFTARDAWGRDLVIAHGRDPYFPGWEDTAQINAFSPQYRQVALDTIMHIADQCDGIRCDMAMLMVNRVFAQTWRGHYHESAMPATEFWDEIIPPIKEHYPDFIFMAEVYWNMEYDMMQQGFDYCYDKTLYDRLVSSHPRDVRVHLVSDISYQRQLVRFIENHDEPRAYGTLGPEKSRPAAALIATLPGATLLHDGQFIGRQAKLPVQICRQPEEPYDADLARFYATLLEETRHQLYQTSTWWLLEVAQPWPNNWTHDNLIAYGWTSGRRHILIVINLTEYRSQGHISLEGWRGIAGRNWRLVDVLDGNARYTRAGDSLITPGLFVDLEPYQVHIFHMHRV